MLRARTQFPLVSAVSVPGRIAFLMLLGLGLLSTASPVAAAPDSASSETEAGTAEVQWIALGKTHKYKSVLTPSDAHAIEAKFEAYSGPLRILEARAEGPVAKDDVLVRFDSEPYLDALRDARESYRMARLSFDGKVRSFRRQEASFRLDRDEAERRLRDAKEELDWYRKVDMKMRMEEIERGMQSSRDRLKDAQEELEQLVKMYASDDLTEETEEIVMRRTKRRVARQEAALKNSEVRHKRRMKREFEREIHKREVSVVRADLSLRSVVEKGELALEKGKHDLEKGERALKKQKEKLDKLEADESGMVLRAPAAGRLFAGSFKAGAWSDRTKSWEALDAESKVAKGQVLFTLIEGHAAQIDIQLPVGRMGQVRVGSQVSVHVEAGDLTLTGAVDLVGALPARNKAGAYFPVRARIDKVPAELPFGVPVQAALVHQVGPAQRALAVPANAVRSKDGKSYVTVLDGEARRDVPFVPGGAHGAFVTVDRGELEAGQTLLIADDEK